jgi:hypothetical protein
VSLPTPGEISRNLSFGGLGKTSALASYHIQSLSNRRSPRHNHDSAILVEYCSGDVYSEEEVGWCLGLRELGIMVSMSKAFPMFNHLIEDLIADPII